MSRLRERIYIKKIEEVIIKGRRQPPGEPTPFYDCRAKVLDLYGQELYEAMAMKLENTVIFKVRYCKKLEELRDKENFIVEWQGRQYEIYYPDFLGYKKDFIKLKCKEVL